MDKYIVVITAEVHRLPIDFESGTTQPEVIASWSKTTPSTKDFESFRKHVQAWLDEWARDKGVLN